MNSTGPPDSPHYFPPLWTLCDAPLPVLHLLVDAAWEHDGESIVEHLLQNHVSSRGIEVTADLLVTSSSAGGGDLVVAGTSLGVVDCKKGAGVSIAHGGSQTGTEDGC